MKICILLVLFISTSVFARTRFVPNRGTTSNVNTVSGTAAVNSIVEKKATVGKMISVSCSCHHETPKPNGTNFSKTCNQKDGGGDALAECSTCCQSDMYGATVVGGSIN
jgi:hypothetical protein